MSRPTFMDALGVPAGTPASLLAIAAHPDDEVIGMGAQLPACRAVVLHLTDGAPISMDDARRLGFASRNSYASARHEESIRALAEAGMSADSLIELGIADQCGSYDLAATTRAVLRAIERVRPDVIVTHPYEGGHPDHDAAAFATYGAMRISRWARKRRLSLVEFASYHARGGSLETCAFPHFPTRQYTAVLSSTQRDLKRRMIARHASQNAVLSCFPIRVERFRRTPTYDFLRPPHCGTLYYERFDWGISGAQWRANARAAAVALGIADT